MCANQSGRNTNASMSKNVCDNFGGTGPQQSPAIDRRRDVELTLTNAARCRHIRARQDHRELPDGASVEIPSYKRSDTDT